MNDFEARWMERYDPQFMATPDGLRCVSCGHGDWDHAPVDRRCCVVCKGLGRACTYPRLGDGRRPLVALGCVARPTTSPN